MWFKRGHDSSVISGYDNNVCGTFSVIQELRRKE